ncbi:MAG TPA: hypothetical protein VK993_02855, partial [Chthoniobacterales bacterium]|nr:hypothetical protein [Chthoniobacterales bacterium]
MRNPHRFYTAVFALILLLAASGRAAAAEAYIIVDAKSGHVLQQSDLRDKRQVGSLTKVATA